MPNESLVEVLTTQRKHASLVGVCREHRMNREPLVQRVRVWGDLLTVEEPPGTLDTVVGADWIWHRWPDSGTVVRKPRGDYESNPYTQPRILDRRTGAEWSALLADTSPKGSIPVEEVLLHGREAIAFEAPAKAGRTLRLSLDRATGIWLAAELDQRPWLDWLTVDFGIVPEPAWFDWPEGT